MTNKRSSSLGKYWKIILALILLLAAVVVFFLSYKPAKTSYETEQGKLNNMITQLHATIANNARYEDVQKLLPDAQAALDESRLKLYQHFPKELKEEDQILYVLYLEELFGTEITFSFGSVAPIAQLSDGAILGGLRLTVNYDTTYEGFKEMIAYLSTDERITSIEEATMDYDPSADRLVGSISLICYILDSPLLDYSEPSISSPETGKPNIYQ